MQYESERNIRRLEKLFIVKSESAFADAHKRSRASGQEVVISQKGCIYKILPDGNRKLLKHLEKPTAVKPGHYDLGA